MDEGKWNKITLYTTTQGVEVITAFLMEHGVSGIEIRDSEDFESFLSNTEIHWDYVDEGLLYLRDIETNVSFYLPENAQGHETYLSVRNDLEQLQTVCNEIDLGSLRLESEVVWEEDWATVWKQYYHPLPVGDKLLIVPSWESIDAGSRTKLLLDPGMAFGTGSHASTKLCLELLEGVVQKGSTVLDIGCGSGILAIAALLLGAERATGVDVDELAVKIALENAALNGVEDRLNTMVGNLTDQVTGKYDLIFANIVADVIIRLCPLIPCFLNPGGSFLTSGIIDIRKNDVLHALGEANISVDEIREENGWVAMRCSL